jgi:hypothetical protein
MQMGRKQHPDTWSTLTNSMAAAHGSSRHLAALTCNDTLQQLTGDVLGQLGKWMGSGAIRWPGVLSTLCCSAAALVASIKSTGQHAAHG